MSPRNSLAARGRRGHRPRDAPTRGGLNREDDHERASPTHARTHGHGARACARSRAARCVAGRDAAGASPAHAGKWMQVSCVNPNKSGGAAKAGRASRPAAAMGRTPAPAAARATRCSRSSARTRPSASAPPRRCSTSRPPGPPSPAASSTSAVRRRRRLQRVGHGGRLHARIRLRRLERLLPVRLRPHPVRARDQRLRGRARDSRRPRREPVPERGLRRRGGQPATKAAAKAPGRWCGCGGRTCCSRTARRRPRAASSGTLLEPRRARQTGTHVHRERPGRPGRLRVTVQVDGQDALRRHA